MSKLAGRSYPGDLDPEEAEKWLNSLVNDFGGKAESREAFAQAVGHKSTSSGTFKRKVADARKYGLMVSRGDFEATELGFHLANPRNESERNESIYEMLRNVPLIAEIHDTLNGGETPEEFWRILTELTDANPKEARDVSDWIEMLYEELLNAERKMKTGTKKESSSVNTADSTEPESTVQSSSEAAQTSEQTTPESAIFVKVGNDELQFEDLTDINIELAQKFLESKKDDPDDGSIQTHFG